MEAGLGVALLPAVVAQRFARIFAVTPLALQEPWARRDYLLAVRTQAVLPTVVQRFVDALRMPGDSAAGAASTDPTPSPTLPKRSARQSHPRSKARP